MSLSSEQFQMFLEAMLERFPSPGALVPLVPPDNREQRVSWAGVPKLDFSQPEENESWFLSFEARMQAARVEEANWLSRFLECPEVNESVSPLLLHDYGPEQCTQLAFERGCHPFFKSCFVRVLIYLGQVLNSDGPWILP